jgi:hypothetical protein
LKPSWVQGSGLVQADFSVGFQWISLLDSYWVKGRAIAPAAISSIYCGLSSGFLSLDAQAFGLTQSVRDSLL